MSAGAPSVLFVHGRSSWYLRYSIRQARRASPRSETVLLSGREIGGDIATSPLERHLKSERAARFREKYVHLHTGNREWELFCFLRWFCALDFMEETGVKAILYLDSDVLLYSSVEEIGQASNIGTIDCGLSVPAQKFESYEWHVSGHASYWTRESLKAFCDFALRSFSEDRYLDMYREKWRRQQEKSENGGVSDMTALYLFWLEHRDGIANFAAVSRGAVFDHNINIPLNSEDDEYEMDGARKRVAFVDDRPMLVRRASHETVRAHGLHLQGGTKNFIPLYYRGGSFSGKPALDGYAFVRRAGQRAKRLAGR